MELNSFSPEELAIEDPKAQGYGNLKYYHFKSEPFRIYGLYDEKSLNRKHCIRMPEEVAKSVSAGVESLNLQTAGGRVRFVTDSPCLAIKMTRSPRVSGLNFSPIGRGGMDVYIKRGEVGEQVLYATFSPSQDLDAIDKFINLPAGNKQITLNLPNYSGVTDLYIGLDSNASLERHPDYSIEKPVLYYGSSITQGGCASRPGMSYENIISRRLDINYLNFGFAGSAKAEDEIVNYMAGLDFSVFVCDYDHNAPTVEHLNDTHEKMYLKIREKHPDVPVIFVTRPNFWLRSNECLQRRDIIYNTYINAQNRGENVIFIDGYSLFAGRNREDCTVDGTHPNDLGMFRMAEVIGKAVEYALRDINV